MSAPLSIAEVAASTNAVGIDFGTTCSVIAYLDSGAEVCLIPDARGQVLIDSAVELMPNGTVAVGSQAGNNESTTVRSPKRLIGSSETAGEKLAHVHRLRYDQQRGAVLEIEGAGEFDAAQIAAAIFAHLKDLIVAHLGDVPEHLVITVPARFGEAQRQVVRRAAQAAGLQPQRLVVEPTAAAVAYGQDVPEGSPTLIFDLGGGTFDASIIERSGDTCEVLATSGDTLLGGDDVDAAIVALWQQVAQIPQAAGALLAQRLQGARRAKEALLETQETLLEAPQTPSVTFTRESLQYAAREVIDRAIAISAEACAQLPAGKTIAAIRMVGGSSQLYGLREKLEKHFKVSAMLADRPQLMVAQGAAFLAESLSRKQVKVMDVVPLNIGVETSHGITQVLIERGTPVPVKAKTTFTNASSEQTAMRFHLVQGQREMVADNESLGHFSLRNLPTMLAGTLRVDLTVEVDAAGNLKVGAQHAVPGGVATSAEISASQQRPLHQIASLLQQASRHREDDLKARAQQELLGLFDEAIVQTREALDTSGNLIGSRLRKSIESLLQQAAGIRETKNSPEIRDFLDRLHATAQPLATARINQAIAQGLTGADIKSIGEHAG